MSHRPAPPLPSQLGLLAALGSGALLGGAYYFQYVVGLPPCDLCYRGSAGRTWSRSLFGLVGARLVRAPAARRWCSR